MYSIHSSTVPHSVPVAKQVPLVFDGDASVNSSVSLASSHASLALTTSNFGSCGSTMSANRTGGASSLLLSKRLRSSQPTPFAVVATEATSDSILAFRMPMDRDYVGPCFETEASIEQLWMASCIDDGVAPQPRASNGHVVNLDAW